MFMVLGGRGYHAVRVRTILHSWARCVKHVFVFTDPSVNISGYTSERRFVYLSAGDAWRRRPYLPMTHMEAVGRLLSRPNSPASKVGWFFLVTDRTFVDVHALLRHLPRDLFAHGIQFLLQLELINHIREVLHIVLVVHLGELFEDHKLVDGRVDQIAAGLLELPELRLGLVDFRGEGLQRLVGFG